MNVITLLLLLLALAAGYAFGVLRGRQQGERVRKEQERLLRETLENCAAHSAQQEGARLRKQHIQELETLLQPLSIHIDRFREQFIKGNADMERYVGDLVRQTATVSEEANHLAAALRGNNKLQGNWGEAVLQNILESSGLTAGRDFEVQAQTADAEGKRYIPDVIVHLPEGRNVVVDSKVSLTAFVAYMGCEDDRQREALLKEHIASVRRHVRELSEKRYDKVVKNTIGYVLLFIPSEAAYVAAVSADTTLASDAYARRVILLNPTNLLMALQLAYNLWQSERQRESVYEIYAAAERLYKKFSTFATNFLQLGRGIRQLSETYERAEKQLSTGRGNIVSQLEGWKKKGLNPSTDIPEGLLKEEDEALE